MHAADPVRDHATRPSIHLTKTKARQINPLSERALSARTDRADQTPPHQVSWLRSGGCGSGPGGARRCRVGNSNEKYSFLHDPFPSRTIRSPAIALSIRLRRV